MKRFLIALLFAFLGALLITSLYRPAPLEQQLLHLQIKQEMPAYADDLSREPAELQALFLSYADDPVLLAKAHLALLRYPDLARPIFVTYGDDEVFRKVLRSYGEDIVLPIHYFVSNEVLTLELLHGMNEAARSATEALRRWWSEDEAAMGGPAEPLSGEERGLYAIHFLNEEGYDFLGQFLRATDGQVAWVQTERVLEAINRFFAGGIRGLETKMSRGEPVGVGDVGWAAVDVAIGFTAFKILRAGRAARVGGQTLTFSQRSAALGAGLWRGTVVGARLVKYGAPAVVAYVAIRHPSVINSVLGRVAEELGLPVAWVQLIGWTLVLLPAVLIVRWLFAPLAWLLSAVVNVLRWGGVSYGRRAS